MGLLVTSVARTITDLARFAAVRVRAGSGRRGPAPRACDAGCSARGASSGASTDGATRRPGRVVAFADGRAESVGETRSRLAIHRAGLPAPALQHEVRHAGGRRLGRTDFCWEEFATVGEFDGRVKYGRLLRPGQEPGDVVFAEKVREDAMRAEGLGMVRWTWPELQAFDAGRGPHPRGVRPRVSVLAEPSALLAAAEASARTISPLRRRRGNAARARSLPWRFVPPSPRPGVQPRGQQAELPPRSTPSSRSRKRRGFVFASGEIYGGTRSAWDYGPLGVELKENIKRQWWRVDGHRPRRRRRPRLAR